MPYSLMIHGGCGDVGDKAHTLESIAKITAEGEAMLRKGAAALDTVEHCVTLLEDDPFFNAGRGSALNHDGNVELDAAIMNGINMQAGAVAGVHRVKNPIRLARKVMERSQHVFLIGRGAEAFAKGNDVTFEADEYFETEARREQWKQAVAQDKVVLDHTNLALEKKLGTVGAVARDTDGNLAAATSTGGIVNKRFGRVGDSPVIGAGVYAENGICAVSCTGVGEQFLRTVLAKHIAEIIRYEKVDAQTAAKRAIEYLVRMVDGEGGVIVVDADGNCGKAFSTPGMIHGYVAEGGSVYAGLT